MDSKRFDNWTRDRAMRFSRRDALRLTGAGAASGALLARSLETLAQTTCTMTVHGETIAGPSAPASYTGTLQFIVGADGALSQAWFTPGGGAPAAASGALVGRAFDLSIALASNQTLALTGTAARSGSSCPSDLAGLLVGPQPGDLGAWQAAGGSSPGAPTTSSGATSGSSGSTAGSSLTCPPPQTACGQNCCPGGATCTDATQGLCACPSGTEQCGLNCVPSCSDGQSLDLDTCTCPGPEAACIQNQQTCQNHGQCCSGYCAGGTCFDCAGKVCGDFGCIDPNKDSQNCGNCGNVCVAPNGSCNNGVCGKSPDGFLCSNHDECASDTCPPSGICGCVPPGVACNYTGECCDQSSGACANGYCAYFGGHACASDTECISGICTNSACVSCTDPGGPCSRSAECCDYNGLGCVNGICPQ